MVLFGQLCATITNDPSVNFDSMNTQHLLSLGVGRDARFDFFGISSTGGWYDVEIQNDRKGATPSRAEYYSSLINASCLAPREFFDQLPEKFVIFITKTDYYKKGMAVYRFFDQYR